MQNEWGDYDNEFCIRDSVGDEFWATASKNPVKKAPMLVLHMSNSQHRDEPVSGISVFLSLADARKLGERLIRYADGGSLVDKEAIND